MCPPAGGKSHLNKRRKKPKGRAKRGERPSPYRFRRPAEKSLINHFQKKERGEEHTGKVGLGSQNSIPA